MVIQNRQIESSGYVVGRDLDQVGPFIARAEEIPQFSGYDRFRIGGIEIIRRQVQRSGNFQ
jgi:hypothetical protein